MKLITQIEVDDFRSIKKCTIGPMGDLTAFAGLNNSGKSNVLRALNAFFTEYTDPEDLIDVDADYFRHDLKKRKKKKIIRVGVTFDLPSTFNFSKKLEQVRKLLKDSSFKVTKEWARDSWTPTYYLNDQKLEPDKIQHVNQFLGLISFRYIPNRVLPLNIVASEHRALRDVLVRRLARSAKVHSAMFEEIKTKSAALIQNIAEHIKGSCDGVDEVRLATPISWQDMVFAFGYRLGTGAVEFEDTLQGSGIQSLLMLETLALIDTDRSQSFGWKQAAVWAVEEPESSLHTSLEARVASYLSELASDPQRKLQILSTTHSDIVLQYADQTVLVSMSKGSSHFEAGDKRKVIQRASEAGVTRWVHPILTYPLSPLVIVEGKYDYEFVSQALRLLGERNIVVSFLGDLEGQGITGGRDKLRQYLKASVRAIRTRVKDAPVIVVLDWETPQKVLAEFQSIMNSDDPFRVLKWPESTVNPCLSRAFKGLERHLPDRIICEADKRSGSVLGTTADDKYTISSDDRGDFKRKAYEVVHEGILKADLIHAEPFIQCIIKECRGSGYNVLL